VPHAFMEGADHAGVDTSPRLHKSPTGIVGLDQVLDGGLPRGRTTLLSGGAGTGKTLLGLEFLANGATIHGESGLFVAFEETADELRANVA
jgi:circadian clock protein KaiC